MNINEVQNINGHSFTINPIEIDESGLVKNWDGGKLEDVGISVQFESTKNEMPNDEYNSLLEIKSDRNNIKTLGLIVDAIKVFNPVYNK